MFVMKKETMEFGSFCLNTLLRFLRNDERVFQMFRPRQELLSQMHFNIRIKSKDKQLADEACEFASFLLRYHQNLDYSDFSKDPEIAIILRRYE